MTANQATYRYPLVLFHFKCFRRRVLHVPIVIQNNAKSQYPLTDCIAPCYRRLMQEALNIRIDSDLKAALIERAEQESRPGRKVTVTEILTRLIVQASNRWATAKGNKA